MELINLVIDLLLHLDAYLAQLIKHHGVLTYAILFVIVFIETGLVVVPFLPGDALLFAAGTLAALGHLDPWLLFSILILATVFGDSVNFRIGRRVGEHVENLKWVRREHLDRTRAFFAKHGGKTIFLARFLPIVRTSAPFVAGMSAMPFGSFLLFNFFGAIAWVSIFVSLGFFFGTLPVVKDNFSLVLAAIIVLSVLPMVYEFMGARLRQRRARQTAKKSSSSSRPISRGGAL